MKIIQMGIYIWYIIGLTLNMLKKQGQRLKDTGLLCFI